MQPIARTPCPLSADNSHTNGLRSVFCHVHAAAENGLCPFRACGRETLRVLLPGEIEDLSRAVEKLCGYRAQTIEEIKNA